MLLCGPGATSAISQSAQGSDAQPSLTALLDSADAALEEGELSLARKLAVRAVGEAPADPRALIARGRVDLASPKVGRFQALELFRRAAHLTPDDPEPHYWIGRTGIALLGDDGEVIARRGLERALELDPLYRDAWELWRRLYRSRDDRLRMAELLQPNAGSTEVQARRALLLLESGECGSADSLLAALEREVSDPRWPAWRAECAFIEGRDDEGQGHYERALELAAADSGGVLWAQLAAIARPDERAAYAALEQAARGDFYRLFWAPRDPNVRTAANERIGEHFRRRAEARDRYRLLHPLSMYHYSQEYRDFVSKISSDERRRYVAAQLERGTRIAQAVAATPGLTSGERVLSAESPGQPSADLQRLIDLDIGFQEPDFEGISPDILPLGRNLPDMVDDRGLVYIRYGPPERVDFNTLDVEEWTYQSGLPLQLRFDTGWYPPDPPLPDMVHRPLTGEQARSVAIAMTSDRSSLPAPLNFGFWFARFRAADESGQTELLVFPDPTVGATGVLWDGAGRELARDSGGGGLPVQLSSPPGRLLLALDAERSDSLGRYRGVIELPDFSRDTLVVSDVLVARSLDVRRPTREAAQLAAVALLEVPAAEPFAIYLEIYGLEAEAGIHRFQVTYEFRRKRGWLARLLGGSRRVALQFERAVQVRDDAVTIEALQVSPGDVAPGSYDLSVRVRDLVTGSDTAGRTVSLQLVGRR